MSQWVFPQSVSTEEGEWLHYKCTACHHMLHQILWLRCLSVLRASKTSVCVTVRHEAQNWRSTNLMWGCDTPAHPQQPLVQTKKTDYMKGKASKWTRPMHWLRSERAGRARAGGFDMQANREEEEEKPSSDTKQQFDYWEWHLLRVKLTVLQVKLCLVSKQKQKGITRNHYKNNYRSADKPDSLHTPSQENRALWFRLGNLFKVQKKVSKHHLLIYIQQSDASKPQLIEHTQWTGADLESMII